MRHFTETSIKILIRAIFETMEVHYYKPEIKKKILETVSILCDKRNSPENIE